MLPRLKHKLERGIGLPKPPLWWNYNMEFQINPMYYFQGLQIMDVIVNENIRAHRPDFGAKILPPRNDYPGWYYQSWIGCRASFRLWL